MKIKLSVITMLLFLLAGCATRQMYNSSAHNVPFLNEKGDSKLAASFSVSDGGSSSNDDNNTATGIDVQGAYAFTDHFAMQASYSGRRLKTIDSATSNFNYSNVFYKKNMFDVGVGYFTPLNDKKKAFFEFFGGAGFGRFSLTDKGVDAVSVPYSRFHDANVFKYYLEPSITFISKRLATSVAARFTLVRFPHVKTNYTKPEQEDLNIDELGKGSYFFFEPACVMSYGFLKLPGLRLEAQVGLNFRLPEKFKPLSYSQANFSIGLVCDIHKLINGGPNNPKD